MDPVLVERFNRHYTPEVYATVSREMERRCREPAGADSLRVWTKVTLPPLRPAILASALLVFLFDFTSFGVILLLGGSQFANLEVEIYLRVLKLPNLSLTALLAMIQLACTLLISILYTRVIARTTFQTSQRSEASNLRKPKAAREKVFIIVLSLLLAVFFFLPLAALPFRSLVRLEADRGQRGEVDYGLTTSYYTELFINRRGSVIYVPPIQATVNSLGYAGATVFPFSSPRVPCRTGSCAAITA